MFSFLLILLPAPSILFDNQIYNTEMIFFDFLYIPFNDLACLVECVLRMCVCVCDYVDYEIGIALKIMWKTCVRFVFTHSTTSMEKHKGIKKKNFNISSKVNLPFVVNLNEFVVKQTPVIWCKWECATNERKSRPVSIFYLDFILFHFFGCDLFTSCTAIVSIKSPSFELSSHHIDNIENTLNK